MSNYRAKSGQEDRHGEMTGAITFNMILSMPPVVIWAMFISPYVLASVAARLWVALALALLLPLLFMPLSRRLWARFSVWSDRR